MRTCTKCLETKPSSEFSYKNKSRGTFCAHCRECNRAYQKQHYLLHRPDYLKKRDVYHKKIDRENQEKMVEYLLEHPCVDCGEKDLCVLEFDHIGTKKASISTLFADSFRWEIILKEIEQCEVRCANCHKRRTAHQFGWYKK